MTTAPLGLQKKATGWAVAVSVLLIILGIVAIALPFVAGIAVTSIVGWMLIFGGITHIVAAFHARGAGAVLWELLVGLVYLVGGGYMIFHPLLGIATLTLFLAAVFLAEGVFEVVSYFNIRGMKNAGWMLFDGLVTILLAGLIWFHWPSSSVWAIGTIVGISLLMSGLKWLMISLASRNVIKLATRESQNRWGSAA
ncbi:MAG TPA: HdeD family acid-resistance protein [Terriglobales bacterium]|nr:HdeD family acid-resistance protein [Terriglobales bacterium]